MARPAAGLQRFIVFALISVAVAAYYKWEVRAAGTDFVWNKSFLGGYYDLLADGFNEGHLYLPADPDPRLLALPNPLDPKAGLDVPKMFDAVLYNRRYYLYHGAGPVVMLFLPWRIFTHHDMPENYALFLFCFGGYLFSALTLMYLVELRPWLLAVMLVALACCTSVPFLLNRIWVYEIAIGAGYFCVAAALYCFLRKWDAPAGFMFGMAVSCRPHMAVVGALAVVAIALADWRRLPRFLLPLGLVGLSIAAYNYARFGNPLEFGLTYQITGEYQGRLVPRLVNVIPGLFYNLLAGIDFSKVFPFLLVPASPRIVPRPPEYFIEPIVGALWLAPFIPAALGVFFLKRLRTLIWIVPASALVILFFLTLTGLSTQRYEVDFLPLLVLASLAVFAELDNRILNAALVASVGFGMAMNASMGLTGPYWEITRNKPDRYVKIARFFSPVERLRPTLNPPFDQRFSSTIEPDLDYRIKPLFSAGQPPYQYQLFIDHIKGATFLVSKFKEDRIVQPIALSPLPEDFEAKYLPQTGEAVVSSRGRELIRHKIGPLIAAPSEIGSP